MRTDYSPYIRVSEGGEVWWRLEDAIKLAAGYLPVRDDNGEMHLLAGAFDGNASEKAGIRNQILVSERTLIGKLGEISRSEEYPWIVRRDDAPYFDAGKFLEWIWKYQTELDIDYPKELGEKLFSAIESLKKAKGRQDLETEYISYPKAMNILRNKWQATPEELAMWLLFEDGGMSAYLNAKELRNPPRFSYVPYTARGEFNYLEPLNACCFIREDIANFNPQRRYITGSKLIERWAKYPDIQPEAFIRAKIRESRLIDAHPIMGLTQGSNPGEPSSPPLEDALFRTDQIEEVELNDFDIASAPTAKVSPSFHVDDAFVALPASVTSLTTLGKAKSKIWWHDNDIFNIAQICGDRLKRKGEKTSTRSIANAVAKDIADKEKRGEGRTAPDGGTIRNTILKGWKYKPE